jgi:hypothetical protein
MKSLFTKAPILGVLIGLMLIAGCNIHSATPPPLPTNAVNQTDASINEVLQSAHAAYVQVYNDVQAGKWKPTAGQKTVLDNLATALNVADPLYQSYHAELLTNSATTEPAALTTALSNVSTALANLQKLPTTN